MLGFDPPGKFTDNAQPSVSEATPTLQTRPPSCFLGWVHVVFPICFSKIVEITPTKR